MSTVQFARAHCDLLAFGFCLAFFSAFGQTFFIALLEPLPPPRCGAEPKRLKAEW